jgi:membrane protease YdiL (CAAX protease family)
VSNLTLFKTSNFTVDCAGRETWFDVVTGPVRYRASTPWSPAAIGVTALIVSVQLVLPSALYGLSPQLYRVISGGQEFSSGSLGLSLLQEIVTGCLIWFAAGLGNGTRRAVLSLPPLKGRVYTYVELAVLVYSIMVPVRFLSQNLLSFLDSQAGRIISATDLSSNWLWLSVLVFVIVSPLTEEFMYRGFLLSALAKSKVGFWGAAIITDSAWTAMHAFYQPWAALPAIFVLGLLVSFLLWRTGSLWTCIFAHITVNAATVFMAVLFGLVLH